MALPRPPPRPLPPQSRRAHQSHRHQHPSQIPTVQKVQKVQMVKVPAQQSTERELLGVVVMVPPWCGRTATEPPNAAVVVPITAAAVAAIARRHSPRRRRLHHRPLTAEAVARPTPSVASTACARTTRSNQPRAGRARAPCCGRAGWEKEKEKKSSIQLHAADTPTHPHPTIHN